MAGIQPNPVPSPAPGNIEKPVVPVVPENGEGGKEPGPAEPVSLIEAAGNTGDGTNESESLNSNLNSSSTAETQRPSENKTISEITSEQVKKEYVTTDQEYINAMDKQAENRRNMLESLKNNLKKVGRVALPLVGAYMGYGLVSGESFSDTIKGLFSLPKDTADFAGEKLEDVVEWGKDQERGLFDVEESFDERQGSGRGGYQNIESGTIEGGPVQKGIFQWAKAAGEGIIPNPLKFANNVTKTLGTPFVTLFGKGILAKGAAYAGVPAWGSVIAPILGVTAGTWAIAKAARFVKDKYDKAFVTARVKEAERGLLREKQLEYAKAEETENLLAARAAEENLEERVSDILGTERQKRRKEGLQNVIAEAAV